MATCIDCDGTGDQDCGRDWQVMTCETCNGSGEVHLCRTCRVRIAKCDDFCVECQVAFMTANPEEFNPEEQSPSGAYIWEKPNWRDAAKQIKAALAAKVAA